MSKESVVASPAMHSSLIKETIYPPINPFIVKPYLQLGDNDVPGLHPELLLAWHVKSAKNEWTVEVKVRGGDYEDIGEVESIKVSALDFEDNTRFFCLLKNLSGGEIFEYRINWHGVVVFKASARAPISNKEKFRVAVVGDVADGGSNSRAIVHRLHEEDPHLTVLAGDIVYKSGLISEYFDNFFPVFNSDVNHPELGAPFLRSHLVTGAVGNHDVKVPKTDRDGREKARGKRRSQYFAFDIFWKHPQNGPNKVEGKHLKLSGENKKYDLIFNEFGTRLVGRTNFSYGYGNSFWVHLDGNDYMDWTQPKLRKWLALQLAGASDFDWKFVVVHQPPFTSDAEYSKEQHIRLLCEIFEAYGVDIVFSGHCHLYERTYPLKFSISPHNDGSLIREGIVAGRLSLDRKFDGDKIRKTDGVIYITTGAGGHELGPEHRPDPGDKPPFTAKIDYDNFSVSLLDIDGKKLTLKQVTAGGEIVDQLNIEK